MCVFLSVYLYVSLWASLCLYLKVILCICTYSYVSVCESNPHSLSPLLPSGNH